MRKRTVKYRTPWDIYVDDRKVTGDYCLGFLVVPNTASFLQKLHRCRQCPARGDGATRVAREIHWNTPHLDTLDTEFKWLDCIFGHRGAKFFVLSWRADESKAATVLRFLRRFCRQKRLSLPYNVVVFLDFDSDHAKAKIQNTIRDAADIARCYHLDSKNNDCLQCCDLLLGATATLGNNPTLRLEFQGLFDRWKAAEALRDSEVKRLLAGYLGTLIDRNGTIVYDLRKRR
jgi:hypothetical protein